MPSRLLVVALEVTPGRGDGAGHRARTRDSCYHEPAQLTELFLFRCQGATARDAVVPLENSIASTSILLFSKLQRANGGCLGA
jgi:hypothetical protein